MADFTTQTRVNSFHYSAPERTSSLHSFREVYRRNEPLTFSAPRVQPHDCRTESRKDSQDPKLWEAKMFTFGMDHTYEGLDQLHYKKVESDPLLRPRDKLLCSVGTRGSGKNQFCFPRGLDTDSGGDVLVADTKNHRVQRYSQGGIYKDEFGLKGEFRGELKNPTDVSILENDDIIVADSGNCRLQIFRPHGRLKHVLNTKAKPLYVASDYEYNMYVTTDQRTVEIYDLNRTLVDEFRVDGPSQGISPLPISLDEEGQIVVCDISDSKIKTFSFNGKLIRQFEPQGSQEGLACQMSSACLDPMGQVLVGDALNHTVNLYNEQGVFISEVLRPTDDLGSVQGCTVGPEGHLIVTESTVNGPHCLKIFRYGTCICHRSRAGSSKRTTPSSD